MAEMFLRLLLLLVDFQYLMVLLFLLLMMQLLPGWELLFYSGLIVEAFGDLVLAVRTFTIPCLLLGTERFQVHLFQHRWNCDLFVLALTCSSSPGKRMKFENL